MKKKIQISILEPLFGPLLIFFMVASVGIWGYVLIERWSFLEALYMVALTLSTVGFREVKPLSETGRIFTIFLIIFGIGTVAYTVGKVVEFMVEGKIGKLARRQRMERKISELKDHFIICGYGRVGRQVGHELLAEKTPLVVVDHNPKIEEELREQNIPYVIGSASSDAVLEEAGIKRAKGLIAAMDSDTENVFVTLSARSMNPNLYIVARAAQVESEEKLKKAGANRVLSPYFIAGRRMAAMALKPVAVDFLDTVMHSEHLELQMAELKIKEKCSLGGLTLAQAQIRQKSGATILAIRKPDGTFNLQPRAETKMTCGDILVAIGTPQQLEALERMIAG